MMVRSFVASVAVSVAVFGISGCGGGADGGQPVFAVSGTVTMSGAPLANATVAFAPQGDQPTAIGKTDKQGNFILTTYDHGDGAAAGSYNVVVSKPAPSRSGASTTQRHGADYKPARTPEDAGHAAEGESSDLIPERYRSSKDTPLKAEVQADGDNEFTFDLE